MHYNFPFNWLLLPDMEIKTQKSILWDKIEFVRNYASGVYTKFSPGIYDEFIYHVD